MINLIIKDGLGNQMFQYAFARLLREKHLERGEQEAIAIITEFINTRQDEANEVRRMSLQHLSVDESVKVIPDKEQHRLMRTFKWRTVMASGIAEVFRWRVLRKFNSNDELAQRRGRYGIYYPYGPYPGHPITLSDARCKFVFGFFQNFTYVEPIADILRKEFMVSTPPSEANGKMLEQISGVNAVCLHIRRGDFLNDRWKHLQICDFSYYDRAMDVILEKTEKPVFFVFSNTHDDLEWIRQNYRFDKKYPGTDSPVDIRYVDLSNPDYEELRLMYSCKHFIISNSTFSWWAAFLAGNSDKIVCAPERWNLEYDDDSNIYDPSWIRIPR